MSNTGRCPDQTQPSGARNCGGRRWVCFFQSCHHAVSSSYSICKENLSKFTQIVANVANVWPDWSVWSDPRPSGQTISDFFRAARVWSDGLRCCQTSSDRGMSDQARAAGISGLTRHDQTDQTDRKFTPECLCGSFRTLK